MNNYTLRKATDADAEAIIGILNYYISHSFAAYPEQPFPIQAFPLLKNMARNELFYVAETSGGAIAGFGMLKHFQPFSTFKHSAEISYFLDAEHTNMGLGSQFLNQLEADARELEVKTILASISSLNDQSISFHSKHGFLECGRLNQVGSKLGQTFDIVWMQKNL